MTDYLVMHAQQVARLVTVLESLPDVDGSSVMDNTLIVWGSASPTAGTAIGTTSSSAASGTFVRGAIFTGPMRPHSNPSPRSGRAIGVLKHNGKPHGHLLVSVAQAMGISTKNHVGLHHLLKVD